MDSVRFGLSVRALRRRRRWIQAELARRARVSQSLIARVERGHADRVTPMVLARICTALGARLTLRIDWQGEALDRLLDAAHARLVELIVAMLNVAGWVTAVETTFAIDHERGSVDVMAFHPPTGWLLIIEAKSVIPDIQATLATLDRKVRLAFAIAASLGWQPRLVGRILVVADGRSNRRRIDIVQATLASHLPQRTVDVRRFLARPEGTMRGLWFLSDRTQATARHRVPGRRAAPRA